MATPGIHVGKPLPRERGPRPRIVEDGGDSAARDVDVVTWCTAQGYNKNRRPTSAEKNPYAQSLPASATHYILTGQAGGVLHVPEGAPMKEFLNKYADDIDRGAKHYISEQRSPIFRMFYDLDLYLDLQPPATSGPEAASAAELARWRLDEDVMPLVEVIREEMAEFFRYTHTAAELRTTLRCVVLTRNPSTCEVHQGQKRTYTKRGVHLIYPNLMVDSHMALTFRESVVWTMRGLTDDPSLGVVGRFRPRPSFNQWSQVFDQAVYHRNGLRMPFSHKGVECSQCHCKQRQRVNCEACYMRGYKERGDFYRPVAAFHGTGEPDPQTLDSIQSNTHKAMATCTIRRDQTGLVTTRGWDIPIGAPKYVVPKEPARQRVYADAGDGLPPRPDDSIAESNDDAKGFARQRHLSEVPRTSEQAIRFLQLVRGWAGGVYERIEMKDVRRSKDGTKYFMRVMGHGSSYCHNVGRGHGQNKVYFVLGLFARKTQGRQFGLVQRCWSTKQTLVDRNVYCSDFSSEMIMLDAHDRDLFLNRAPMANAMMARKVNQHAPGLDGQARLVQGVVNQLNVPLLPNANPWKHGREDDGLATPQVPYKVGVSPRSGTSSASSLASDSSDAKRQATDATATAAVLFDDIDVAPMEGRVLPTSRPAIVSSKSQRPRLPMVSAPPPTPLPIPSRQDAQQRETPSRGVPQSQEQASTEPTPMSTT